MALFQSSVLKDHLRLQDVQQVDEAYKTFISFFHNPEIQENIRSSKEEQFQATFLNELFVKVLGYTMNPQPGYDLTTEFKNQKNARKADGALLKDGLAIGVIELKGTNTKHLEGIRQQAFDYKANQKGCVYVITSNFEKLRFYINDATEFEEFDLFELNREDFSLLYLCMHKDSILSNKPLKIKEASLVEEEVITKQFYKDYSVFKRELFRDLVLRNVDRIKTENQAGIHPETARDSELVSGYNPEAETRKQIRLSLFKKSQKLIDRFLFIFFAEDRGLLPPNSIHRILTDWNKLKELDAVMPLYDRFKLYFSFLDTGRKGTDTKAEIFAYNGGLFKPDPILDTIEINDELLYKHASQLAKYDFESQVDVNILGHIFENSLNEVEEVENQILKEDEDESGSSPSTSSGRTSKRKKDGVFYTPKYITKYIVENTVGRLCEEKKSELGFREEEYYRGRKQRQTNTVKALIKILDDYREWLLKLSICDPACGSGAFLNQALDFLIKEHQYIDEMKAKLLGGGLIFSDIETTILENNIYGVDINEESVEIAKLSLWLRTAQPRRKLNDLSSNIKCGNSLIDDKEVAGDKAFKWEEEFPEVFADGGFDVVIGNPPYLSTKQIDNKSKHYFRENFKTAIGQFDLYGLFIEQSLNLLKREGEFSFITSNTFLSNKDFLVLRKILLTETEIHSIVNLGETVFEDASLDVAILSFRKTTTHNPKILIIKDRNDFDQNISSTINQKFYWNEINNYEFKINCEEKDFILLDKLLKDSIYLDSILNLPRGIEIGGNSEKISEVPLPQFEKLLVGRDISRYKTSFAQRYIKFEEDGSVFKTKDIYSQPKLLIQRIRNLSLKRRIIATYDDKGFLCTNTLRIGNLKNEEFNLKYILALLNSSTINYLFLKFFLNKDIYAYQLKTIPIKIARPEVQTLFSSKVDFLLEVKSNFYSIHSNITRFLTANGANKLSKKLQSWHELKFGEFIKELNKAIKASNKERAKEAAKGVALSGVEMPQLTKKDEFEWMELFEENKKKAVELQREIEKTDKEIDQLVYELYGLTEEEIQIIEQ